MGELEQTTDMEARLVRLEARSNQARWWRAATLTVLALAISLPFAVDALGPVPHSFSSGAPVSASQMNANFAYLQNAITAVEGQVPSGTVAFFDLANCPTGWSELTEARGRTIVGLVGSAGTLKGQVGTALTDREDRTHSHSVPAATTGSDGAHNHRWYDNGTFSSSGSALPLGPAAVAAGGGFTFPNISTDSGPYYTDNEAAHTHSITARTSGNANTSDVMPYVQLLVCRRD